MATGDGLIPMRPTSITSSGGSATINANGGVDFTSVTTLSLNGVFTSDYDNYFIIATNEQTSTESHNVRLRAAGTDASGADYTQQYLICNDSTRSAARVTGQTSAVQLLLCDETARSGHAVWVGNPAVAQATTFRHNNSYARDGARLWRNTYGHSASASYDGFTIVMGGSASVTGNICVYGYEE